MAPIQSTFVNAEFFFRMQKCSTTTCRHGEQSTEVSRRNSNNGQGVQRGRNLVHGFGAVFVESKPHLHLSRRALTGWERVTVSSEGRPMWVGAVLLIIEHLILRGSLYEALAVLLSWNTFCRESDWESLSWDNVVVESDGENDCPRVAIVFGDSKKGLSTKTGPDQSLLLQGRALRRIISKLHRKEKKKGGRSKVFPFEQTHYRGLWSKAQVRIGFRSATLTPHAMRHARPSYLVSSGKASLEQIRRRGRWRQLKSVQRYAKEAHPLMHKMSMPEALRDVGERLITKPNEFLLGALLMSKARHSGLGRLWICAIREELTLCESSAMDFTYGVDDSGLTYASFDGSTEGNSPH